jgi:glycosyltransferase involved in cell wall biosynthesis
MVFFRKIFRAIDFFVSIVLSFLFLILILFRRVFGKIKINNQKNTLLSITKDGIHRILQCNGKNYFEWDFTRPHANKTYVFYLGLENNQIFRLGNKVLGINKIIPLERLRHILPFTTTSIQQFLSLIITINLIKKLSPKVVEVMFPSKLALRAIFIKLLMPIKLVTQVRGNLDLIYYFNQFPTFWPFKMFFKPFETFQLMWDKFISLIFYRSCDLVIGYNVNNMLSAISNGAHPGKCKLSRIKIELSMLGVNKIPRNQLKEIPMNGEIISLWSRLSPEKLVFETIQAFEMLLSNYSKEIYFVIIGDGPEMLRIKDYVNDSKYKKNIILLGQRNRDFIAQVAMNSSLSVVPYGGSSLVEAVMLNIPVVAFDIEWHNELIRDGETGYLADFPDKKHLADKMLESITNPLKTKKLANNAKQLAESMFDTKKTNENESRYYMTLFE